VLLARDVSGGKAMVKIIGLVTPGVGMAISMLFTLSVSSTPVFAFCDYQKDAVVNCKEEVQSGVKNTLQSTDEGERAKSVGEAVGNCIKCALEKLGTQMKNFSSDGPTSGTATK
jgi:hypothetical protein